MTPAARRVVFVFVVVVNISTAFNGLRKGLLITFLLGLLGGSTLSAECCLNIAGNSGDSVPTAVPPFVHSNVGHSPMVDNSQTRAIAGSSNVHRYYQTSTAAPTKPNRKYTRKNKPISRITDIMHGEQISSGVEQKSDGSSRHCTPSEEQATSLGRGHSNAIKRRRTTSTATKNSRSAQLHSGTSSTYIDLGDCNNVCEHCLALFWYEERLKGHEHVHQPKYSTC